MDPMQLLVDTSWIFPSLEISNHVAYRSAESHPLKGSSSEQWSAWGASTVVDTGPTTFEAKYL